MKSSSIFTKKFFANTFHTCMQVLKSVGSIMRVRRNYYKHIPRAPRNSVSTVTTFLEIDCSTEAGIQFLREYTQNVYNENLEELSKYKIY